LRNIPSRPLPKDPNPDSPPTFLFFIRRLLKIGAQVRVSARRVHVALASGYPHIDVFHHAWRNLRAGPEGAAAV